MAEDGGFSVEFSTRARSDLIASFCGENLENETRNGNEPELTELTEPSAFEFRQSRRAGAHDRLQLESAPAADSLQRRVGTV